MSGRWRIDPNETAKHDHLVLETAAHRLALHDPRRFGFVDLVDTEALDQWPAFAAMGPEPLGPGLTVEHLRAALKDRKPAIKLMLLDQRIVAGLGNIYVCEALHRAGLSPRRLAKTLTPARAVRLAAAILRDYSRPDGELGYFASRFDVYDREGKPCRPPCGGTVKRIVQGGRSTWFCPKCQK